MIADCSESEYLTKGLSLLVGQYGSMACSVLFTFWLARLLDPADFGRLAVGVFSLDIFNAFTDWGWEQGILTAEHETLSRAYSTHFVVRCILGGLPFFVGLGLIFFDVTLFSSTVHRIALALAVGFWAEKISLTYKTILERSYALKRLAFLETCALLGSFCCAIVAVQAGWGMFALVVQRLMERILLLIGYVCMSPWKCGLEFDVSIFKRWIRVFGYQTLIGGLLSLFLYDFMGAFVGVKSGTHEGGLYARSFKMATLPLMITTVFNRLAIPLYAASKGNLQTIKTIFLKAQFVKALLLIPIQLLFVLTASLWIPWVLGDQWGDAIVLYQVLGVYGILRGFYDDVPSLFMYGVRWPWVQLQQHVVQACCMALMVALFTPWLSGALLAASIMCGAMFLTVIALWLRVILLLQITPSDGIECVREIACAGMRIGRDLMQRITAPRKSDDGEKKDSTHWRTFFR